MTVKVIIDPKRCIGCATCTIVAPDIFELAPEGHSRIREKYRGNSEFEGVLPDDMYELAMQAMSRCLGSAILVTKKK